MSERISGCLRALRQRERLLAVSWGAARWLALVAAMLLVACAVDWSIDRWRTTPQWVRLALFAGQAAVWLAAGLWFVARPMWRRPKDSVVAEWLEVWDARLDHRLVTAVELRGHRADAGVSDELIEQVAREADDAIADCSAERVLDGQRLRWSAWLTAGVAAVVGLASLILPLPTLVARQFLLDLPIPRHVSLENLNASVWPGGEPVELRFAVTGPRPPARGKLRIKPVGRSPETYLMELETASPDSASPAIFVAKVPASIEDFSYDAWLGDGRLREPGFVHFEPRPVVQRVEAWSQLPGYCGRRPDGKPYERQLPRGDVAGLEGSLVRVAIDVQKPVVSARLECLDGNGVRRRDHRLDLDAEGTRAAGAFDLRVDETAYRIVVVDAFGFVNLDPPKRTLRVVQDEPPQVVILPEHFTAFVGQGVSSDTEVEGKPVPLTPRGGKIRVAYYCRDAHGLARAQLAYRILRRDDPDNPGPWRHLPLREVTPGEGVGPFNPRQGVFQNSGLDDQIEFHAEPSPDPFASPGRLEGGGRFDFQIGKLDVSVGDEMEYAVEVFDANPDPQHPPGRSEVRRKRVVTPAELVEWLMQKAEHENRIRDLERKQRDVRPGQ